MEKRVISVSELTGEELRRWHRIATRERESRELLKRIKEEEDKIRCEIRAVFGEIINE